MSSRANLAAHLTLNDSGFKAGIQRAQLQAKRFAGNFQALGSGMARSGLAPLISSLTAGLSAGAFARGIKGSIALGSKLHDLSQQTGIAVGELYKLRGSFEDSGKTAEDIGPAIARMQKEIGTGGEKFEKLGISFEKLQRLQPAQQFQSIARDITSIQNPAERSAAAMAIFGKSGASLIPVFEDIKNIDLSALSNAAKIIERNAAAFDKLGDSASAAKRNVEGFMVGVSSGMLKGLQGGADRLNEKDWSAAGEGIGKALSEGFAVGKKMFDSDVKDIAKFKKLLGFYDRAQPALPKPAGPQNIDVTSEDQGWRGLASFKSFSDPIFNKANFPIPNPSGRPVSNLMGSDNFLKFFHPGDREGEKLKSLGAYSSLMTAGPGGMSAAYNQTKGSIWDAPKKPGEDQSGVDLKGVEEKLDSLNTKMDQYWGQ